MEERRPLLIAGAFAAAVLLGVIIGLATAPQGRPGGASSPSPASVPAEQQPPLAPTGWEQARVPGRAHNMKVDRGGELRRALQISFVSWARAQPGGFGPTQDEVNVPQPLYYGAIEGATAAEDVYWAAGRAEVSGASRPSNPQVWKRVGSGPWMLARNGAGACGVLPQALFGPEVWRGVPPLCSAA
jgi:hypothetical protein